MRHSRIRVILTSLVAIVVVALGCSREIPPPTPISADELPAALDHAFLKAKAETKELAAQVSAAVKAQDYPKALSALQALSGVSGLNKEQVSMLSRGMLCVNTLLQSAQSKGDQKAAEVLRLQRINK